MASCRMLRTWSRTESMYVWRSAEFLSTSMSRSCTIPLNATRFGISLLLRRHVLHVVSLASNRDSGRCRRHLSQRGLAAQTVHNWPAHFMRQFLHAENNRKIKIEFCIKIKASWRVKVFEKLIPVKFASLVDAPPICTVSFSTKTKKKYLSAFHYYLFYYCYYYEFIITIVKLTIKR